MEKKRTKRACKILFQNRGINYWNFWHSGINTLVDQLFLSGSINFKMVADQLMVNCRPITSISNENIAKICNFARSDHRLTIREMADALNSSSYAIRSILTEDLNTLNSFRNCVRRADRATTSCAPEMIQVLLLISQIENFVEKEGVWFHWKLQGKYEEGS